ncbi:hypothetical protein MWU58_09580 [Flavobacteriaceae bacterium S0825]|uniref:hypothetical protein n=1 Tax=Gaetbulibacter sp. S0825 TaxID=2720084 RepID=UPI001431B86A|nr:hypothetical protein [Gaetbulibacter sp. S0825]MCK0109544.1 hypothetical protein [Flavobacteriaceae bacterium S0825]NIX65177.1 hypothetical protein [Gaetbulibacter sp. S0825]
MENKIKKKIPLMINEAYKNKLEASVKVILEKIGIAQQKAKDYLNIDLSKTDKAIEFIKSYTSENDSENIDKQNQLLFIKFNKEISKLMSDYPNLIKTKALDMFCTNNDRGQVKDLIYLIVTINLGIKRLGATNLKFESFVLNDEFAYNRKIDTQLKELYTTYCKTNKQVELKVLAEKLKETVNHSIKVGLISDNALGINIENIIDINTGKVKYNRIATIK